MNLFKTLIAAFFNFFRFKSNHNQQAAVPSSAESDVKKPIQQTFWPWFVAQQARFYQIITDVGYSNGEELIDILDQLNQDQHGYIYVIGIMGEDDVAELIFSAEGQVEHFLRIEELVQAAPMLNNWKFTALKPQVPVKFLSCDWQGHQFNQMSLIFYRRHNDSYPKNIEIVVSHAAYTPERQHDFFREVYNYLDYYLGENNVVTQIDVLDIISEQSSKLGLIKIADLKDYLATQNQLQHSLQQLIMIDPSQYQYGGFESNTEDGQRITSFLNTSLLQWDHQCAFPWVIVIEFNYPALPSGMPSENDLSLLDEIEEYLLEALQSTAGYLHLAQETGAKQRLIYLACQDFRLPSKVIAELKQNYGHRFEIKGNYHKDKYWTQLDHFN